MKLNGKTALVTGGTTGIGLESAKLLHREGARVIVTGVNEARIAEARRELGPEVEVVRADVRQAADIESLFRTVRERFTHLDILFANAGVGTVAPFEAVTERRSTISSRSTSKAFSSPCRNRRRSCRRAAVSC
jgi:NAD(P)-dependent dehydrogenase (short-subunit alcohol dehydrogenase family)